MRWRHYRHRGQWHRSELWGREGSLATCYPWRRRDFDPFERVEWYTHAGFESVEGSAATRRQAMTAAREALNKQTSRNIATTR